LATTGGFLYYHRDLRRLSRLETDGESSMERTKDNGLRYLHQLHLRLREVHDQLERGPQQLKAREQFAQQKQDELEAQRQKLKATRVMADQKALQLKSNEAKIQDLKGKLNSASSNREFDIIKSQIEADTVANSVLEDEILDALEKVDAAQIAVKKLEEEVAHAKAEQARVAAEIAAQEPRLKARAEDLQRDVIAAESILPTEIAAMYRRLVQAHGAGAMAEVEGSICSSCYVNIPPQMVVQLRSGHPIFCKTCGRLLYLGQESMSRIRASLFGTIFHTRHHLAMSPCMPLEGRGISPLLSLVVIHNIFESVGICIPSRQRRRA
jgi:predicted  nucleic acid-binding Zn-ribbon protein